MCLDWSRFADAMAGVWPNDAMKAQQTGAGSSARRHAGVMKPLDRRLGAFVGCLVGRYSVILLQYIH